MRIIHIITLGAPSILFLLSVESRKRGQSAGTEHARPPCGDRERRWSQREAEQAQYGGMPRMGVEG